MGKFWTAFYNMHMTVENKNVCLLEGSVSQWKPALGQHQPRLDKAAAVVLFVCHELCLILHNLCSGGHVTLGRN